MKVLQHIVKLNLYLQKTEISNYTYWNGTNKLLTQSNK